MSRQTAEITIRDYGTITVQLDPECAPITVANFVDLGRSHTRGAISMARAMDPDSASSQFFICHQDAKFLDGSYAAFGFVTDGMEVVDKVCEQAKPVDGNGTIRRKEQPVIESIVIKTAD
jgi:peptidyl-prolyl cis-trans isomerase B (cyclophilin B)